MEIDREWELKAICRDRDPDDWFSASKSVTREAKRLCEEVCPVREECLDAVLDREAQAPKTLRFGIVAGLTGPQRAAIASSRARSGRPRADCGTPSAYKRHQSKGEPIDQACKDAWAAAHREDRQSQPAKASAAL